MRSDCGKVITLGDSVEFVRLLIIPNTASAESRQKAEDNELTNLCSCGCSTGISIVTD